MTTGATRAGDSGMRTILSGCAWHTRAAVQSFQRGMVCLRNAGEIMLFCSVIQRTGDLHSLRQRKETKMSIPNPAGPSAPAADPKGAPEAWQATRAQTQLVRDEAAYLEAEQKDIGRPVGDNLRELFVSCDAGPAMQQQFDHLRPEFIAIHDVATHSSRKLIAGIAAASKGAVQRLVIRRQGYGTT